MTFTVAGALPVSLRALRAYNAALGFLDILLLPPICLT